MKYFVLSAMLWGLVSCGNSNPKATDTPSPAPQKETVAKENLEEVTLRIEGMTCAHGCAATIEKNLNNTDGIQKATVDFDNQTAVVSFDKAKLSKASIISVIEESNGGEAYKVISQ